MTEGTKRPADERVLVLLPAEGDAELLRAIQTESGWSVFLCQDSNAIHRELEAGCESMVAASGAFTPAERERLAGFLARRPQGSEIPILWIADAGTEEPLLAWAMDSLGLVTVLERPAHPIPVLSALRTAMKARSRQPEIHEQETRLPEIEHRLVGEEAHAHLAAIVESSDDAIISKTLDGIIVSWNSGAERIFGYTAEEAIGRSIRMIIPRERWGEEDLLLKRLRRGERMEHFETIRVAKTGRRVDISLTVSPIRNVQGQVIGASKVARDITARKLAEEAIRASEERFRFLAETIPSMVWTAAPDGTIQYANGRWLEYVGHSPEVNAARWPDLVIHPDDRARCLETWNQALTAGKDYEIEVRNRRQDGVYRWFLTRAFPLKDVEGRVLSWFGVTMDIHDQKEMQEQLREADRRKDEFLAVLAHELRNPLAPIRNSLVTIRLTGTGNSLQARGMEIMERQVDHLVRLVDDLLEVSRISQGKIELRKEPSTLNDIVQNALEISRTLVEERGHDLVVELPLDPMTIEVDPVRLAQVIANLVNNAAKYTDPGGQIRLRAKREDGTVVISVRDTGIGIAPELLPRIFDMFSQGDRSAGRAHGGLGVGLTLVRSLVEMHGGRVEARSEGKGKGSEFVVRLPAPEPESVPSRDKKAAGEKGGLPLPGRRVLIVDDNVDSAQSLGTLLTFLGHEVRLAHEGHSALESAQDFHPHLALVDINMPGLNGYELGRRLRKEPGLEGLRLVALTGYGQEEDRRRSRDAGFDDHLVKPVDLPSLQKHLKAPEAGTAFSVS